MRILLIISFIFCLIKIFGQNDEKIEYLYDNAGNRYFRHIIYFYVDDENKLYHLDSTKINGKDTIVDVIENVIISVTPNPTNNKLFIKTSLTDNKAAYIILTDINGKILIEGEINSNSEIDMSMLPPGIYFISILIDKSRSEWKIIKE